MDNILTEAFKAFDLLDEDVFPATKDGEERLKQFMDGDRLEEISVIDPDIDSIEDVKESYIGDVILNCPVCQSKFYKKPEDVTIDEEKELANIEEECPYCQTAGGFEIVGEVAPYYKHGETEVKVDDEIVEESCSRKPRPRRKAITESPDLGRDLEKYQDWVDYDMKRYGKISDKTKDELNKAGLEVVKDDHGDYEVIAKDRRALGESTSIKYVDFTYDGKGRTKEEWEKIWKQDDAYRPSRENETFDDWFKASKENGYLKLTEAKEDHYPVKNYVQAHKDELTGETPKAMRDDLIRILERGLEEADEKDKNQFKNAIVKAKNTRDNGVYSMVSTYLTGIRANPVTESFEEIEVKKIVSNEELIKLICSKKIYIKDVTFKPLKEEMIRFIKDANDFIKEESLKLPEFTQDNTYFQWEWDKDIKWLDLLPSITDKRALRTNAFQYLMESCWMESEGGSNTVVTKNGLLGPNFEVPELNLVENSVENNIKALLKNNLYSAFGLTKEELSSPVTESFEEIEVKTDKEKIKVESEGEKTKVEVEPREEIEDYEDEEGMIEPVSDELKDELTSEEDVEIEDFDEESFDELEERYLRKVYENVKSYKTTKGTIKGNKLTLEGVITFNSGSKKKTQFVFESKFKTKKGKLKFLGENINFSTNKKAFTLTGEMKGKKLVTESFTYNYTAKDAKTGRSQKLYGTIRK